jgi:hypothetical protein
MIDIRKMDWKNVYSSLNERGYAVISSVLSRDECSHLRGFYGDDHVFRKVISMERYRVGRGEYKYFSYPLPPAIQALREGLYGPLSLVANDWARTLGVGQQYPNEHAEFIRHCRSQGQSRPTPLILRYQPGGYNTLHQDLYGTVYFPFQVVIVLTQPGRDHDGGELVFTHQGDAVIFTTNFRPVKGIRGYYRAHVKHGVSEVKRGERYALGIIFHDAT